MVRLQKHIKFTTERVSDQNKMKTFYQISDKIALPCRDDNLLRLCFEPYKVTKTSLLQGLDTHACVYGGKQSVDEQ